MTGRLIFSRLAPLMGAVATLALLAMPVVGATKKRQPSTPPPTAPETPKPELLTDEEKAGHSPHSSMAQVHKEKNAGSIESFWFAAGDKFNGKESPDITHHGLDIEAQFSYDSAHDADSTLISQGDSQFGWSIHFVNGKPSFTINYDGLHTTLSSDDRLPAGRVTLRGLLGLDGTLGINATGLKSGARGYAPMYNGFPRKPDQGLEVGHTSGLPTPAPTSTPEASANGASKAPSTPDKGDITFVRLSLLPAGPPTNSETPPAKTPATKAPSKSKKKG